MRITPIALMSKPLDSSVSTAKVRIAPPAISNRLTPIPMAGPPLSAVTVQYPPGPTANRDRSLAGRAQTSMTRSNSDPRRYRSLRASRRLAVLGLGDAEDAVGEQSDRDDPQCHDAPRRVGELDQGARRPLCCRRFE